MTHLPTFEEYVSACEQRRRDGSDLVPRDHLHGLYIGYYADYVPLWLDAFGADIRVTFADDMVRDPYAVIGGLCRWLGIDDRVVDTLDLTPRNRTQHPRSLRLARAAYSVKRSADRRQLLPTSVREALRRGYHRANAGRPPSGMTEDMRRHVQELYADSNRQTAQALRAHGYELLPAWLAADE
jgi:hypothetical protein